MPDAIDTLSDEIAFDIFIADGGVDDFREMTDAELFTIVHRELINRLTDYVVIATKRLQEGPA
jgi:hypothetical protein